MSGQSFSVGVGYKQILVWMALGSLFKLCPQLVDGELKLGSIKQIAFSTVGIGNIFCTLNDEWVHVGEI